jgi:hypothetical protein
MVRPNNREARVGPSSDGFAVTFSRKREKGFSARRRAMFVTADEGRDALPLPLAGEGWGEGNPPRLIFS